MQRPLYEALGFRPTCLRAALVLLGLAGLPGAGEAPVVRAADAPAGTAEAGRVLAGVEAWLRGTRDLEARFIQSMTSGILASTLEEEGVLYLKRPGRMRWEYRRPERKIAVVRGDDAWLYLPEDRQLVEAGPEWRQSLLARILVGERPLAELFDAEVLNREEDRVRLRLVPRAGGGEFEQVVLTVQLPAHAIVEAEVVDVGGDRMKYRFRGLRRNRGLPESLFVLRVPEGVDVLESGQDGRDSGPALP